MTDARALPVAAHPPRRGTPVLLAVVVSLTLLLGNAGLAFAAGPGLGGTLAGTRHRVMVPDAPASLNLFHSDAFRYQDPNYAACTSAATMLMLNVIAIRGTGSGGFDWRVSRSGDLRDAILRWSRDHHTMTGGDGTDPHGWRNALNYYGWGSSNLRSDRFYDDRSFGSYESAVRAAVRALILTRKPVGVLAWRGRHAQVMTGYYGLEGDPFAKTSSGAWVNDFTVDGVYLSDPLRSADIVNRRISWSSFKSSADTGIRFQRYRETDSPYDDPYTAPDGVPATTEWYDKFVLILPVR